MESLMPESEMISILDDAKSNLALNSGFESIAMMFYDSRFSKLEKYFIGHHAISMAFDNGLGFPDQFAEYRFITDLVNSGEIKYLPSNFKDDYRLLLNNKVSIDNEYLYDSNKLSKNFNYEFSEERSINASNRITKEEVF